MSTRDAVTATRRFGLGPRPGELASIARDPRAFVLSSLERRNAIEITAPGLEPSHAVFAKAQQAAREVQIARAFGDERGKSPPGQKVASAPSGSGMSASDTPAMTGGEMGGGASPASPLPAPVAATDTPQQIRREAFQREAAARIDHAVSTDAALLERLVMFWSNHFCVNASKGAVLGVAGAFEREAIRPHVLGRFSDMLLAVEKHPAMLVYLDNQASTGPNSRVGRNRNRGLNENLAREILELHTLGVDGGYTQADVTNLARVITGWTVGFPNQPGSEPGKFQFAAQRHEPGVFPVLGKRYGNAGVAAGEQCLSDLARHPSTARHIARKLAIHFVSDAPPPELVARLEKSFRDSDGDLAQLARVLVTSDEAWSAPARKIIPPYDYIVAVRRAFGLDNLPPLEQVRVMASLGHALWRPPSPKGWPDGDESWASPSTLRERLRVAERVGLQLAHQGKDARQMAAELFGDALSKETRQAVAFAEAREQAFALLIMSPEFQRR